MTRRIAACALAWLLIATAWLLATHYAITREET